jgi:phage baseplate assembly protein W
VSTTTTASVYEPLQLHLQATFRIKMAPAPSIHPSVAKILTTPLGSSRSGGGSD